MAPYFSIQTARRIRRATRVAFWISAFPLVLAAQSLANGGPNGFLMLVIFAVPFLVVATLSLCAYLVALKHSQQHNGPEFERALGGGSDRPIVLFLRSFDVAQSSLKARVLFALDVLSQGALDGRGRGSAYDAEEELDNAIGDDAMFVAIGDKRASYGSFKIIVSDEEWQDVFFKLAALAQMIVVLPGASASTIWEISQILASSDYLEKSVFVMPRREPAKARTSWATLAKVAATELSAGLPHYHSEGCYFRLGPDRQVLGKTAHLEAFTKAVGKAFRSRAAASTIDIDQIWRAAS